MARIASVTGWLLKQSPDLVEKLERKGDIVRIKNALELGLGGVELLVPSGIDVYQVMREVRHEKLFFFTARANKDTTPAYCSYVGTSKDRLNFVENARILLMNPWYDSISSSKILHRLETGVAKPNLYLVDCIKQKGRHPFLRDINRKP